MKILLVLLALASASVAVVDASRGVRKFKADVKSHPPGLGDIVVPSWEGNVARSPGGGRPRPRPKPRPDNPDGGRPGRPNNPAVGSGHNCGRDLKRRGGTGCSENPEYSGSSGDPSEESVDASFIAPDFNHIDPPQVYKDNGRKRITALESKIQEMRDNPGANFDKDKREALPPWTHGYRESNHEAWSTQGVDGFAKVDFVFDDLGLDMGMQFRGGTVQAVTRDKPEDEPSAAQAVFDNYFSTNDKREGVMVARWNNMTPKTNIANEDARLWWSDLTFQVSREMRGKPIEDLKYVVRDEIIQQGTTKTIREAAAALNFKKDKDGHPWGTLSHEEDTSAIEKEYFEMLVGTKNGKGISRLLEDYPTTFGGKKIKKIHAWSCADPEDSSDYALAFELGI